MGTKKLKLAMAGEKIIIAGLALQLATFVAFVIVAADFHIRMNRKVRNASATSISTSGNEWRKMLMILHTVSSLIMLRCIFRQVEYSMGNSSYLNAHEWCLYVFDTIPMVLVLMLMLVLQPTKYLSGKTLSVGLDSEELGVLGKGR